MRFSVIIPVHNGGVDLRRCLEAVASSSRVPDEVIVVDDASTDDSGMTAHACGVRVVTISKGPVGPARARNIGAAQASGDILVFVDADVTIHRDALGMIEKYLLGYPEVAALFGSYDDDPPHRNLASLYKNLLHHAVHHGSEREGSTFWSGLGAIRRDVFRAVGGFDETFIRPSIEDIELGVRLRRAGHRIWLCPEVQGTHLKRWRIDSMLRSDIWDRAVPWSRLIFATSHLPSELNLDLRTRTSAVAAWGALALSLLGFFRPSLWVGGSVFVATTIVLNLPLYKLFRRRGGLLFAAGAVSLHVLYLLYSSLVFVSLGARHVFVQWLGRSRSEVDARRSTR